MHNRSVYKCSYDSVHANVINYLLKPKMAASLLAKNKYLPLPASIFTSFILFYCFCPAVFSEGLSGMLL